MFPVLLNTPNKPQVVKYLTSILATLLDLGLVIKQAHWNLRGKEFIAIHQMLDGFKEGFQDYKGTDDLADSVAERIAQLGGQVYGRREDVVQNSIFNEFPGDIGDVDKILPLLGKYFADASNDIRLKQETISKYGDNTSASKLDDVLDTLDYSYWKINAHLISDSSNRNTKMF